MNRHNANSGSDPFDEIPDLDLRHLQAEAARGSWRRRLLRWGLTLVAAAVILVLALPTLVCQPAVRNYALNQFWPAEAGALTIDELRVGWFSPLQAQGIKWVDPQGQPMLDVQRVQGNRSLADLLQDTADMGTVVIDQPTVHLQLRADGSNLEDAIQTLAVAFASDEADAQPAVAAEPLSLGVTVNLVQAQVVATQPSTGETWQLQQTDAQLTIPQAVGAPWTVNTSGRLDNGSFTLDAQLPVQLIAENQPLGPQGEINLQTIALPLAPFRYAATRAGTTLEQLAGQLNMNVQSNWQTNAPGGTPHMVARADVQLANLQLAAQQLIGPDVLRMTDTHCSARVGWQGQHLDVQQCRLNTDLGSAELAAQVDLNQYADPDQLMAAIRRQPLQTSGKIDLAALARSFPQLLKIREDVQVGGGEARWNLQSDVAVGRPTRWQGQLQTADVRLLRDGQALDWQFPLDVHFAARDGQQWELEQLDAQSDFFQVSGTGQLQSGTITAQANLEQLVYQLGQVIDLQGMYVAGQLQAEWNWAEAETDQLQLNGLTRLSDLVVAQNEILLCREQDLRTSATATARLKGQSISELSAARVDVLSGTDFLIALLQQPIENPDSRSNWPIAVRLKGALGSWLGRLKTMGVAQEWDVQGEVDSELQLTANAVGAAIHKLVVDVQNLQARTEGIAIDEPSLQLATGGTVNFRSYASNFPNTTVESKTLSLDAKNMGIELQPHFAATGDADFRADLARLTGWVTTPTSQQIAGDAAGHLRLQTRRQTTSMQLQGSVDQLTVTQPEQPQPTWHEPQVSLQVQADYLADRDLVQLSQAEINGRAVSLSAGGVIQDLATSPQAELSGTYGYDLAGLSVMLADLLGPDIQFQGQQRQKFAIRGPLMPSPTAPVTIETSLAKPAGPASSAAELVSRQLTAQAGFAWQQGVLYAVPLGAGQMNAQLVNGVLKVNPTQVSVGQRGHLNLAPAIDLNSAQLVMTHPAGTVLDQVQLTPQMTGSWMKYVAPLLADATAAEGSFSVALARTSVPLYDPMNGQVDGELAIHGGSLGPGPLATQFLDLATQIKRVVGQGQSRVADSTRSWVNLKPQRIRFQMAEQRVYHEGLEMEIDGIVVRTRGTVGIVEDDLDMVAEVPIPDKWLGSKLAGMRGQTLQIPITGTTSQPRLDPKVLRQLTMQLGTQAVQGYLRSELTDKVQKELGGSLGDVLGDPQKALGDKLQKELSRGLNKLFD